MPPVVPPLPTRRRKQHEVPDIPPDTAATALQSRYRGRLVRKGTVDQRKVIEAWLSSQPTSLVVWDFDQTVLRIHAFARGVRAEQVADRWERDVADKQFFTGFALACMLTSSRYAAQRRPKVRAFASRLALFAGERAAAV